MSISRAYRFYPSPASLLRILLILTMSACVFISDARAGGSDKYPKCFIGTFLVKEGNGTTSVWSLGARGVLMITSSAQEALNFSTAQGAWVRTGKLQAQATSLDFSFDSEGGLINTAKVNADLTFTDKNCGAMEGEFTVYFYQPDVDPLDPDSVPENIITDTFTGQRVTVEQ
ncbi:MAG TPA: hypothetical protein VHC46_05190 [Thermodesulfobacteriota bacterium]|nr:hypothetical protein [Thermodesulfobacteriota bacterium]